MYRLCVSFLMGVIATAFVGNHIDTGTVRAKQIIVTSPDGKRSVTIQANNQVAGVWIYSKTTGRHVRMYDQDVYGSFGIRYDATKSGDEIAIASDEIGNGFLQN